MRVLHLNVAMLSVHAFSTYASALRPCVRVYQLCVHLINVLNNVFLATDTAEEPNLIPPLTDGNPYKFAGTELVNFAKCRSISKVRTHSLVPSPLLVFAVSALDVSRSRPCDAQLTSSFFHYLPFPLPVSPFLHPSSSFVVFRRRPSFPSFIIHKPTRSSSRSRRISRRPTASNLFPPSSSISPT